MVLDAASKRKQSGTSFAESLRMLLTLLILLFLNSSQAGAREPSIQEVQQEAIHTMGYNQGQIDGWDKKTRLAAALPRIQVGFQRDLKDTVSLTTKDSVSITGGDVFVGPSESNFDQNFNQGTVVGVKAYWYLDQLVFNRDMLAASAEKRAWVRERNNILQQVTNAYFTRLRLIREIKTGRDPLAAREKKKLLLDQATAMIDADTGGWFSQQIAK
jgi:hypothetical protein